MFDTASGASLGAPNTHQCQCLLEALCRAVALGLQARRAWRVGVDSYVFVAAALANRREAKQRP
eukprot:13348089-Alexandrium_andersonii.AAC.1